MHSSRSSTVLVWALGWAALALGCGESGGSEDVASSSSASVLAFGPQFQVNTFTTSFQSAGAVASQPGGGFVAVWESDGSAGTDTSGTSIQGQRFSSDGGMAGTEFQVNSSTLNDQSAAALATSGADGFVVAWAAAYADPDRSVGLMGQRFDASGVPLGAGFPINSDTDLDQTDPAIDMAPDGSFVVAWPTAGSGTELLGVSDPEANFGDLGLTTGVPLVKRVLTDLDDDTGDVVEVLFHGLAYEPVTAILVAGAVGFANGSPNTKLYEIDVNTGALTAIGKLGGGAATVITGGLTFDTRSVGLESLRIANVVNGTTGQLLRLTPSADTPANTMLIGSTDFPLNAMAFDPLPVDPNAPTLEFQILAVSGRALYSVNPEAGTPNLMSTLIDADLGVEIVGLGLDPNTRILYGTGTDGTLYDIDFTCASPCTRAMPIADVSAIGMRIEGLALVPGFDGSDIDPPSVKARRFDSAGLPLGPEFQVNTYTRYSQTAPSVGVGPTGDFVVVWQSYGSSGADTSQTSIQAQRYASDGTPIGGEYQVNTTAPDGQQSPALDMGDDGSFIVVWHSQKSVGTDSSGMSIQGQRFDSSGAPLCCEFQVNSYTPDTQAPAVVSVGPSGDFVVVWQSQGSAGSDTDQNSIQGQRYAADGSALGDEFQVNTYTTYGQGFPAVTTTGAGEFVVTWTSSGADTGDVSDSSIQAQRFAP